MSKLAWTELRFVLSDHFHCWIARRHALSKARVSSSRIDHGCGSCPSASAGKPSIIAGGQAPAQSLGLLLAEEARKIRVSDAMTTQAESSWHSPPTRRGNRRTRAASLPAHREWRPAHINILILPLHRSARARK
jgi:hypothetical protein